MQKLKILATLIVLFASATAFAKIAGTYTLEVEGMGPQPEGQEVTLTLAVDDEGKYSAVLNTPMGKEKSDSVKVDEGKFSFSTTVEGPQGNMSLSYSGTVKDGELKGKVASAAMGIEMSFTGKLKEEESEEGADEEAEEGSAEDTPEA